MRKKADSDMPVGKLTEVPDFLPPPEALIASSDLIKVTVTLTRPSVEFFKREAKKNHTKYQKMIRAVLNNYAQHYLSRPH